MGRGMTLVTLVTLTLALAKETCADAI